MEHSAPVIVDKFEDNDGEHGKDDREHDQMCPTGENIVLCHFIGGLLHGLSAALQDLFQLSGLLDLPERFLEFGTALADPEDGIPEQGVSRGRI